MLENILIVEDEVISARFLEAMINKLLHLSPDIAFTDQEVFYKCNDKNYQIVLLDINLGNNSTLNGIEVLEKLKKDQKINGTKFIACTAYATVEDKQKYLDYGFEDLVIKPYDVYKLVKYIETLITDEII